MYKANGITKTFPLPEGVSGDAVYWANASGGFVTLRLGTSYKIEDGNVVFGEAPPAGLTVTFEEPAASAAGGKTPVCTVIWPDGRIEAVHDDPSVLLAAARAEIAAARRIRAEIQADGERVLALTRGYEATARETLSSKLDKYRDLVEEAVTRAAAGARDEINDNVDRKLLEIRKKHKEVTSVHDDMARMAEEAKEAAGGLGEELCARLCLEGKELLSGIEKAGREREEFERIISAARRDMDAFRAETSREFASRSEMVLEEFRSLKRVIEGEIKSVVGSAKRETDSALSEMRAERGEMRNAMRNMNRIERLAIEREGR
jgi:hypothetical protein